MKSKTKERIAGTIIAGAGIAGMTIMNVGLAKSIALDKNKPTSLQDRINDSQVDTSSYHSIINEKSKEIYDRLRNGEITVAQFEEEYLALTNKYSLEDWAREQSNPEVQKIVSQYDADYTSYSLEQENMMKQIGTGMGFLGISTVGGLSAETYLRKKNGVGIVNNNLDNMIIKGFKSNPPSAMDIEDPCNTTTTSQGDTTQTKEYGDGIDTHLSHRGRNPRYCKDHEMGK